MEVERLTKTKTKSLKSLMAGHTFLYNQNYYMITEEDEENEVDEIYVINMGPVSTGKIRNLSGNTKVTPITFKLVEVPDEN